MSNEDRFEKHAKDLRYRVNNCQDLRSLFEVLSCVATNSEINNSNLLSSIDDLVQQTKNVSKNWIQTNVLEKPKNLRTISLADAGICLFKTEILALILSFNRFSEISKCNAVSKRFRDVIEAPQTCLLQNIVISIYECQFYADAVRNFLGWNNNNVEERDYISIDDCKSFDWNEEYMELFTNRSPRIRFMGSFPQINMHRVLSYVRNACALDMHQCFVRDLQDNKHSIFKAEEICVNPFQLDKIHLDCFPQLKRIRLYIHKDKFKVKNPFQPTRQRVYPFRLDAWKKDLHDGYFHMVESVHFMPLNKLANLFLKTEMLHLKAVKWIDILQKDSAWLKLRQTAENVQLPEVPRLTFRYLMCLEDLVSTGLNVEALGNHVVELGLLVYPNQDESEIRNFINVIKAFPKLTRLHIHDRNPEIFNPDLVPEDVGDDRLPLLTKVYILRRCSFPDRDKVIMSTLDECGFLAQVCSQEIVIETDADREYRQKYG